MKCRSSFSSRAPIEGPANQHFQFQERRRGLRIALNRPPRLEPFRVGRQRPDPGLQPIGSNHELVVGKQRGNLLLVRLQLIERRPDGRVFVGRVFQFDHRQRQPVDEHHHVGPAVVLPFDHGELVDGQPIVVVGVFIVHQRHAVAPQHAAVAHILDLDPIPQHPVKGPVVGHERRPVEPHDFAKGVFSGLLGNRRVQPVDGVPEPLGQQLRR